MSSENVATHSTAEKEHGALNSGTETHNNAAQRHGHGHGGQQLIALPAGMSLAEGGSLHPGLWKPLEHRKFANPAPLGLCAFALTTFVLSAINMHTRDVTAPQIVVSLAFGYGGFVQLLAGMW